MSCYLSAQSVHGEIVNYGNLFRAAITVNGSVLLLTGGETITSCVVDVTYYPFDDQACYIEIESWTDGDSKVGLTRK